MVTIPKRRFSVEAPDLSVGVPKPITPPRAAFGGQAQEAIATGIKQIAQPFEKRLQERADLEKKQRANAIEMAFKNDLDNQLLSTREISQVRDGKKVSVPEGYLNRRGLYANGSSDEMINNNKQKMQQYLGQFNDPLERAEMQTKFQDYFRGRLNDVVRHQVGEDKKYKNEQSVAYRKRIAQEAALPNANLADIMRRMDSDTDVLANFNGTAPEVVELEKQANSVEVLKNYMPTSFLKDASGGDMLAAIKTYEPILGPEGTKELKKLVDTTKKEAKAEVETQKISNAMGIFDQIGSGQFDWSAENIAELQATTPLPDGMAKGLMRNLENSDDIISSDDDDLTLSTYSNLLNYKDDAAKAKALTDIVAGYSGVKGEKDLAILVKSLKDYAGNQQVAGDIRTMVNASIGTGIKAANIGKDYTNALNEGMKPEEARQKVIDMYGLNVEGSRKENFFRPSANPSEGQNKGGFFEKRMKIIGDVHRETAKGLVNIFASSPQVIGAFMKEYGESPEENSNFWMDVIKTPLTIGKQIAEQIPAVRQSKQAAKQSAVFVGEKMINANREWLLKSGLDRPESGWQNQVAFDIGSGVGSLGLSVGTALLSKSPFAAASLFAALQKGRIYQEGRQAGLTPAEASAKSNVAAAVEGGIELVGLNAILKGYGGRLMNVISKSFANAAEEGAQQLSEDTIADWRGLDMQQKFNNAIYSSAIGFLSGAPVATVLDINEHKQNIKDLQKAGFSEEQAQNIIVETHKAAIEEIQTIADEIDVELQRFDSEGGGQEQAQPAKPKEQKLHPALAKSEAVQRMGDFKSAEEYAAAIIPSKKQVLARKFFTDLYNQVKGVQEGVADEMIQPVKTSDVKSSGGGETLQVTGGQVVEQGVADTRPDLISKKKRTNVMPTGVRKESRAYQRAVEFFEEELKNQPVAEYTTVSIPDQMSRAFQLAEQEPKLTKKVAYVMEPSPSGVRETAVSIAYANKMLEEKNYEEFGKAYRSRSLRQSARGQEIVLEKGADVNINSPEHFMKQVLDARANQAGKKIFDVKKSEGGPKQEAMKRVRVEAGKLKQEIVQQKNLDIQEAQKIIDGLIC